MKKISIQENLGGIKGRLKITLRDVVTGAERVQYIDNLNPSVVKAMVANNFGNAVPTNSMTFTHCALGTSTTSPSSGDTQLGAEVYRNIVASISSSGNVAYTTGFFTSTETSGTYEEIGFFSNGSLTANSGVLVSKVNAHITKSTSETLTIDLELTIG